MNSSLLSEEVQEYINANLSTDIHKILLKKSPFNDVSSKEVVEQIESKLKCKQKLPTWFATKNIYYPNKLNLSQSSSEKTARYKAALVKGDSIVDCTAGLGVDCVAFSKQMQQVVHLEKNEELSTIAQHNFKTLGIENIECLSEDSISFLKNSSKSYDWIFIDPSRRDSVNNKVYYLSDCEPDVTKHMGLLFSKSSNLLIKTGPLLDLSVGLNQLPNVKEIHIVAINNDVKEVLWILQRDYCKEPLIKTLNFKNNTEQVFEFKPSEESASVATYGNPEKYLYEPNAAILKSGAFQYIGSYYQLNKLHPNSHLYTSSQLIQFPGRIFKILNVIDYSKKSIKKLNLSKANISTRNFPDSVETIRKKLKLQAGGESYVFCTTDIDQNLTLLICDQIFVI
ncbi:class I SAM-dependent methyltransferase [Maribacter sp. X9]|uniref:class I SAM-dependent methyltransferase n=1 Tax=Maribacter sp. X9 TaxID=3402159 RepID=UPI003AF3AA6B